MQQKIICCLEGCKNIIIATHANPDGDALGSLISMGIYLGGIYPGFKNKKVTLYVESHIPAVYRFLPHIDKVVHKIDENMVYDVAIILDCSDFDRIGKAKEIIRKIPEIINIDHHITNTFFGNYQIIDTKACATAEIVYRILKEMNEPINRDIATLLYTAILTDTGSFRFSNTNAFAFSICEELVSIGVAPYDVAQNVYGVYSLGRIKLLNIGIDSIEISSNGKLAMMVFTQDMLQMTNTKIEDVDGMINYAKRIEDVKVAALILEYKRNNNKNFNSKFHVSLRSDGTINVASIASKFGGGGHISAAGFNIESKISDLKSVIFKFSEGL